MKIYRSKKSEKGILETYDKLLKLWNITYQEKDIMTRYGTSHVIIAGNENAKPLVLFHGVGDDSALMWIYNAKELGKYFRIYAIDTIGGAGKSRPNENYNKQFDDALWIDDTLDGLRLDCVNMAGTSHGSYLIQYYCVVRPERVHKGIGMAGSVAAGKAGSPLKIMMKIFLPEALFPTKKNVVKLIKKLSGKNAGVFLEQPLIMEHYTWLLKGFNNMAMGNHKLIGFDDDQIDAIRDKILYLVGESDPFELLGGKDLLQNYHMNARFFSEVGHGINHEIADTINKIMIETFK